MTTDQFQVLIGILTGIIGLLVTIITLVIKGTLGWSTLKADVKALKDDITDIKDRLIYVERRGSNALQNRRERRKL